MLWRGYIHIIIRYKRLLIATYKIIITYAYVITTIASVITTIIIIIVVGGSTWTQTSAPSNNNINWHGISSDSTGKYLAALEFYFGYIYTSSSG